MWRAIAILYILLSLGYHFMKGSFTSLLLAIPSFFLVILLVKNTDGSGSYKQQ